MPKIYLASNSKGRKALLELCGIRFRVMPSEVSEEYRLTRGVSYAGLVKTNALKKAQAVAGRLKSGIVIAADTIVVQGGRIFGKPKSLRDTRLMLKRFSGRPQWLYTGLAVVDAGCGKALVECEKTKIYLDTLTKKDIEDYLRRERPLDKAGGFDILGRGAFFVRRVEGCFYNVAGLPVRRLYRMLKKAGVNLLMCSFCFSTFLSVAFLSGCSTEYNVVTGQEETYYYSTEREEQLGKTIARQIEQEYKMADDPLEQQRVEEIGKKIVAVSDRKDIDYTFKVLQDDEINAVSLPGGFVYVNSGLIERVENDDQLAAVIAHEVGHIVARHSIKKLQAMQGYSLLRLLLTQAPGSGEIGTAADAAFLELLLGYSRDDELLADQLGTRYARLAGYDPRGMIGFLERLQDINRRKPLRPRTYLKTHPYVPDRVRVVKQELGEKISFDDYINIEETKGQ